MTEVTTKGKDNEGEKGMSFPLYCEHPAVLSRTRYPHEIHYSWLPILLDSYAIDDYERQLDVRRGILTRGQRIACHKRCFSCCTNQAIPLMPLEFMGISWFYSEICDADTKRIIRPRLVNHHRSIECPFLMDNVCSIYPVRPLACRDFFVYGKPCGLDEDITATRPHDIHPPNLEISRYIAFRLFDYPSFGCSTMNDKERAFNEGLIASRSRLMHKWDWAEYIKLSESRFG